MTHPALRRLPRAALASATASALAIGGFLAAPTARADISTSTATAVTNAVFTWGLSTETGGGAFDGSCNFLSAGVAGDAGASRPWTEADGFYRTSDGNVQILKDGPSDTRVTPTWATKCQTGTGAPVVAWQPATKTGNVVSIANGTGSFNPDGSGRITWDGDFTVAFYGGLTYWSASDPVLTVDASGKGQVTATASGYGASQDGESWTALPATSIVLADLSDVELTGTGFTATPDYREVEVAVGSGSPQSRTGANWGAFPQSFIDFQLTTGQSSYWYSSGGSRDVAKVATPLSVSYDTTPITVSVSKTQRLNADGDTVTVKGAGFLPNGAATTGTRPPLAGKFTGAYVVFGKFADDWQPSAGVASSVRKVLSQKWAVHAEDMATIGGPNAGAIEIQPDGTFEAVLPVSVGETDGEGNYGIYTYPGGGAKHAAFETYTPISFALTTSIPKISGTAQVGKTLTAIRGTWPQNPTYSYQWYANGKAISKATGKSFTVTASQRGAEIKVKVTGKKSGYETVTRTSSATKKVASGTLSTVTPRISGTVKVGKKLTVIRGSWSSGTSYSYQWYANGSKISKATGKSYTLKSAQRGKKITVKVTGKKAGYTTVTRTSKTSAKVA